MTTRCILGKGSEPVGCLEHKGGNRKSGNFTCMQMDQRHGDSRQLSNSHLKRGYISQLTTTKIYIFLNENGERWGTFMELQRVRGGTYGVGSWQLPFMRICISMAFGICIERLAALATCATLVRCICRFTLTSSLTKIGGKKSSYYLYGSPSAASCTH